MHSRGTVKLREGPLSALASSVWGSEESLARYQPPGTTEAGPGLLRCSVMYQSSAAPATHRTIVWSSVATTAGPTFVEVRAEGPGVHHVPRPVPQRGPEPRLDVGVPQPHRAVSVTRRVVRLDLS